MPYRRWFAVLVLFAAGSSLSFSAPPVTRPTSEPAGRTTVVWVSIDGFRHDYLDRFHPPALSRLYAEGAYTKRETPIFPSLTFPNHVAQVTGVGVDGHGIPMNSFRDPAADDGRGKTYDFPGDSRLLRAEPIWATATRQGVRTACVDWPLSYDQSGPDKAACADAAFDKDETDRHRLDRTLAVLTDAAAAGQPPYQLVLSYLSDVDHVGHASGPDGPPIGDAVLAADHNVGRFVQGVTAWFTATHPAADDLVLIFSTDHGMVPVTASVNLDRLLGSDLVDARLTTVTSGPVATLFCPPDRSGPIVARLADRPFLTAWRSADVPPADHFADPTRLGQVVVLLRPGYTFTKQRLATTLPAPHAAGGMHGYDPAVCPDMQGSAVVWSLRHPAGGRDLGPVSNTQWDATVCRLLGIAPPPAADPRAVVIR